MSRSTKTQRVVAVLAGLLLMVGVLGTARPASADFTGFYLTTSALNMRAQSTQFSELIMVVPDRAGVVHVANNVNGYTLVSYLGTTGWVLTAYLEDTNGGSSDLPEFNGEAMVLEDLNFRSGPGTTYYVNWVLAAGAVIEVSDRVENGFRCVRVDGEVGYAYDDYLATSHTTTSALNMRALPNVNSTLLQVVPWGATVTYAGGGSGGYLNVTYAGITGYVLGAYLV